MNKRGDRVIARDREIGDLDPLILRITASEVLTADFTRIIVDTKESIRSTSAAFGNFPISVISEISGKKLLSAGHQVRPRKNS
jgi:hypothetical protein